MRLLPEERSDEVSALSRRVAASFLGQSVRRFALMEGFDRCIVLSSQALTALIPLFIVVASAAPAGQEDVIARSIIRRFNLSGASADAVEQLFLTPAGASSSVSVFSALLLIYSAMAFSRRLQSMYRAAWGRTKAGLRSTMYAGLGLVAFTVMIGLSYLVRELASRFPLEWLWTIPLQAGVGLVLWTCIPYLLLERQVHWRRLLATGGASAVCMTILAIGTPIYMPGMMDRATADFGLFGVTITLLGWLLAAAGIVIGCAVMGAQFDSSDARWLVRLKSRFALTDPAAAGEFVETEQPADRVVDGGLTSGDLLTIVHVLVNWSIMAAAVWVATALVPGITVNGGLGTYLAVSVLFGLVNAMVGPVLQWLAGAQSWLRMGASALLVNGALFAVTAGLSPNLDVAGAGSALLGAVVVAVTGTLLELVIRPSAPSSSP
ncbi:phage holin family protein [Nocardioides sp. P5_E3]